MNINNLTIINFPSTIRSGNIPLINLIKVLSPLANKIFLISGNIGSYKSKNLIIYEIHHRVRENKLLRIFSYLITQLQMTFNLLKIINKTDFFLFFVGGETLTIPLLFIKLFRKKTAILIAGNPGMVSYIHQDSFSRILNLLSKINLHLTNQIIIYSPHIVQQRNLEKFEPKISVAHEHFVDFNEFRVIKPYAERELVLGYLGHLGQVKGIINLVKAFPLILKSKKNKKKIKLLIAGEGLLSSDIKKFIVENNLENHIELVGWLERDELKDFLNQIKLLIVPSYSEGLPNVIIESMACGTPVLANSVGAIPDIIEDGVNGFLMDGNSPKNICHNVIRSLDMVNQEVSSKAFFSMKKEFSYEETVARWKYLMEDL